jgi:hypothetical protein
MPTEPPGSPATSTQLPLEKLKELLSQVAFICSLLVTWMPSARHTDAVSSAMLPVLR